MTNCLGIYFDDNIVKYAKLQKNNNGTVEIKEHGIKYVRSTLKETLEKIISDTNTEKETPVIVNAPKVEYIEFQVFKQISSNDLQNIVKLEFEDWCEKKSVGSQNYSYVYSISPAIIGDYHRGIMGICNKSEIEKFSTIGENKVTAMYPTEMIIPTTVPDDEKNYIIINLDDSLQVTTVLNGKTVYSSIYEVGMKKIFEKFIDILGSYEKAYEACKQLNVFSDSEDDNNKIQLEEIVEPVLQDVLRCITQDVNRHKDSISKLYITGSSVLFTNIDTLFTEYFGVRCAILKPKFINDVSGVRNMAETLEVLNAITIAHEYLMPVTTGLEFVKKNIVKENFFKKIFAKKKKENIDEKKLTSKLASTTAINVSWNKMTEYLMYPVIVCSLVIISYYAFSNIYVGQVTKMKKEINARNTKYEEMIALVDSDKTSISSASNEYKAINDEVSSIKEQIETNQIGKFSTYNVASFTQKLIKVIPKNVTLKTISSDDNKKVKIVAEADKYQNIGYFVANLRLQPDILSNVVVNSITNGSVVIVEIGGDLP